MPVDKHDNDINFTTLPEPLSRVKSQIFKFRSNSVVNIFTEIPHADRGNINMKYIKWDFSLKTRCGPSGSTKGWAEAKIQLFQYMIMLHIKLK